MAKNVLVAFASKHGATAEIAQKIGEGLCRNGVQADVLPVNGIRDLNSYRAVILGSALYIGKWQEDAVAFLKANEKGLSGLPVWLFSSGPTGQGDPLELLSGERIPAALQAVADRIHPRDIAVFHGFINSDQLNFMEKFAIKSIVKKPFGDFRDWEMIASWTNQIAAALKNA